MRLTAIAMLAALAMTTPAQQTPNRPGGVVILKASDVQWTDYPGRPGVKVAVVEGDMTRPGPFMMRVKFPANYKLAPHTHPGMEHTTVLSGAMHLGYGTNPDGATEVLPGGTVILTPPGTPHFFWTSEETIVQTHGVGPWSSTPVKGIAP